jgi:hypothetical protein
VSQVQAPPLPVVAVLLAVAALLVGLHLWATKGTGELREPEQSRLAVTPRTTLSLWYHHLWAGLFHKSWGHLAYNLAVFAVAFPLATRTMGPVQTMAHAYWIGPAVVLALHLLVVLPLANAGAPYAMRSLDYPLVGFSVMAYSIAGAALTLAPPKTAIVVAAGLVAFEALLAVVSTGPFIGLYHTVGFAVGYLVRSLLR